MIDAPTKSATPHIAHNRWLILIAIFKFAQALLFIAIGVGALRLLHKDIGDMLTQLADHLRFNTEPRFIFCSPLETLNLSVCPSTEEKKTRCIKNSKIDQN